MLTAEEVAAAARSPSEAPQGAVDSEPDAAAEDAVVVPDEGDGGMMQSLGRGLMNSLGLGNTRTRRSAGVAPITDAPQARWR